MTAANWFRSQNEELLPSPSLLIYHERLNANLQRMVALAGSPARLRPHIKTHKMREMLDLQLALGITKFKCATLAEAHLAAQAGAHDILWAYPPVGPALTSLAEMVRAYPHTTFSVLCDHPKGLRDLARIAQAISSPRNAPAPFGTRPSPAQQPRNAPAAVGARPSRAQGAGHAPRRQPHSQTAAFEVLLDLDVGYHRTGIAPGPPAAELYAALAATPGLAPGGLHAYDGHITNTDVVARTEACAQAFAPVAQFKRQLEHAGLPVPRVVAGGTPTFPMYAQRANVECSPGTCVFWDAGYESKFPDLGFVPAALVLTRVISKPGPHRLCVDLGHKAIAAEMPPPRVRFLNLSEAKQVMHSEEHLLLETPSAADFAIGDCLYGVPWHICPTVALHSQAAVLNKGALVGYWKVAARDRQLRF